MQRPQFCGQQHRAALLQRARVLRAVLQNVAARAETHAQRHDHAFAQRIDRRVGHFRKALAEKVEKRPWLFAQHRRWGVVSHRAGGLLCVLAHGAQRVNHIVARVAEGEQQALE